MMKMLNPAGFLAVAALIALPATALEISPIPEGKLCAFSFTYDDGVKAHYTHALAMHRKYAYPATFFIITDRVGTEDRDAVYCSWTELKTMAEAGMEVASHTKSHRNMVNIESADAEVTEEMKVGLTHDEIIQLRMQLREKNWPELLSEVVDSRDALQSNCQNQVRAYAFAGNYCPDWTSRLMKEVRGYVRAGDSIRLSTSPGDSEAIYREKIAANVLVKDRVGCVMIHGVGTKERGDGWNPIPSLEVYESLFKIIKENEGKIHVDTFGNNAAYAARAKHSRLTAKGSHTFELTLDGSASDIYDAGEVWVRVAEGETVAINGAVVTPNVCGAVLAKTGDTLSVVTETQPPPGDHPSSGVLTAIPYSSAMKATSSSKYSSNRDAIYAINGRGMNADGETHLNGDADYAMWLAQEGDKSPWCKVDLGRTCVLGLIKVWNFNFTRGTSAFTNRGVKGVDVYVTTDESAVGTATPDSEVWMQLGSYLLPQAGGTANEPAFLIDGFDPTAARSVLFVVKSNYGGGYGGLSELRFYGFSEGGEGEDEDEDCDDPVPPSVDPTAKEGVVVYEGFSAKDYALDEGTDGKSFSETQLNPANRIDSIGLGKSGWHQNNSGRIRIYNAELGLKLPSEMAGYPNLGSSVGFDVGSKASGVRSAHVLLADGVLSPTKAVKGVFAFRVLLSVDEKAAAVMTKADNLRRATSENSVDGNYFGAGFVKAQTDSGKNKFNMLVDTTAGISFFLMKNAEGKLKCVLGLEGTALEADGYAPLKEVVMGDVEPGKAYICYAEVKLNMNGDDIIDAGYQEVGKFRLKWQSKWQVTGLKADVISADAYPTAIAFSGCYGTNGGYFRADEFCAGTDLASVLAMPEKGMSVVVK